jgi:hypothetical protein
VGLSTSLICYLKFIIHEINFKIVKSGIVVLIGREKIDLADADVAVHWML